MRLQILPKLHQRDVQFARVEPFVSTEADVALDVPGGFLELRHRQRGHVAGQKGQPLRGAAGLFPFFRVEKCPRAVGEGRAFRVQFPQRTVRQRPAHLRAGHLGGFGMVFRELPQAALPRVEIAAAMRVLFSVVVGIGDIPIPDPVRPGRAARHQRFVQHKQHGARSQADGKIRRANPPQTHTRRAHGGDFIVPRVIGERVKQRQQQRHRQDRHQKFRRLRDRVAEDIQKMQLVLLQLLQLREQIVGNPENQKPAEAVSHRREQFAEQIPVKQPHGGRVFGAEAAGQVLLLNAASRQSTGPAGGPAVHARFRISKLVGFHR